jgi:hypothetical protein
MGEALFGIEWGEDVERYCAGCGYNLRGLTSARCPECGLEIEAAAGSAIPWEAWRELGNVHAFWRTFREAAFHPKRLSQAASHPVKASSAYWFRVIVSFIAALPMSAVFWMIVAVDRGTWFLSIWQSGGQRSAMTMTPPPSWWEPAILWSAGATFVIVMPVAAFIAYYLGSGVLGFWVTTSEMSAERKQRAVAVAAYACAPLVMMIVPTAAFVLAWATADMNDPFFHGVFLSSVVVAPATFGGIAGMCVVNASILISSITHCGWLRKAAAWLGLPACYALAVCAGLVGFPMLVGLIWIMIDSLRR